MRKNLKISIVIKNVIWSEETLMHRAVPPSNYFFSNSFTDNQAKQIKKEVICVQILLEIHLTEHGRFHFKVGQLLTHLSLSHPAGTWRQNDVDAT